MPPVSNVSKLVLVQCVMCFHLQKTATSEISILDAWGETGHVQNSLPQEEGGGKGMGSAQTLLMQPGIQGSLTHKGSVVGFFLCPGTNELDGIIVFLLHILTSVRDIGAEELKKGLAYP